MDELETRKGLPDALRVLLKDYPRDLWEAHANFDGLTRFWLQRHLMFRDVMGRLRANSELFMDGDSDAQAHAGETSRYAGFLLNELHGHHQIEDHHYFPKLSGLDPRLLRGFDILDADHHALDGHIYRLAEATNGFLRRYAETDAHDKAGELHEALSAFEGFLDRHLTDEEDLIVPVILAYAPKLH